MRSYGGFCPVAKASEIIAERWTPLIIRELLMSSHRFHELEQGLPGIPHSLLVQRLRALERAGIVERRADAKGRRVAYWLTPAGQELFDVVQALGCWGQRWVNHDIGPADTDPQLLVWDIHRRIHLDRLPERRIVVQLEFRGARQRTFWLVLERPEPSVCLKDPEFDVDLLVTADTVALHQVWLGRLALADAMHRGLVELSGPRDLVRAFPDWLALSVFASVPPVAAARSRT
jgi:DNA-binding HxlR family transcriptional regulator